MYFDRLAKFAILVLRNNGPEQNRSICCRDENGGGRMTPFAGSTATQAEGTAISLTQGGEGHPRPLIVGARGERHVLR